MEWTERNRERLEIALTEAEIVGVRQPATDSIAFLIHVAALPEVGPMDNDARRMLVLNGVKEARFLLRRVTTDGNGRAKRGITPSTALRLAKALGTSPQFWLTGQLAVDLYQATKDEEQMRAVEQIKPLRMAL